MKRATKLWITVAVLLAGLGAAAGSLASGDPEEEVLLPAPQIVTIMYSNGQYRVTPAEPRVFNGQDVVFKNETQHPAQVMVPHRSFWNKDKTDENGGGILEVPKLGGEQKMTINSYHSAKGTFYYQVYLGGLPRVSEMDPPVRAQVIEAWQREPHVYPILFAIGDSPPRMIVQ